MKYKSAQLKNGQFAVMSGTAKYFKNTVTSNELEAKQTALTMSIEFYNDQMLRAYTELKKTCDEKNLADEIKLEGTDCFTNLGDLTR